MATYADSAWATQAEAAAHWADAATLTPGVATALLTAATNSLRSMAPVLAAGDTVPAGYQLAVIYTARDLRAAILRGDTDLIGVGEYAVRARPVSAVVRSLLRPEPAVPVVG
jgi:hypothetical protein